MILGAGIYSILGQAAGIAGYGLWQGFALAGIAALLTALSYAELASAFPKAGGEYIYLKNAFSEYNWISGTVGNVMIFSGSASAATVATAFAVYLGDFVSISKICAAGGILLIFTALNILGIRQSSLVNAVFTFVEVIGLVLFIWLGWSSPGFGEGIRVAPNSASISSAALLIFAYFGFENIVNFSEEAKEPKKSIPRAIFFSLLISTVLYVLVSLSAVALMPPDQLKLTQSAISSATRGASPEIAKILGGIALFSTANTVLIALLSTSRILFGVSLGGSLPSFISSTLKSRKSPWAAAIVAFGLSMIFLPLGKVELIASVASFTTMISFIGVNVALIALRIRKPELLRPFRVPLSIKSLPLLPILGILVCGAFLFQFNKLVYFVGLGAVGVSAGVYFFYSMIKRRTIQ